MLTLLALNHAPALKPFVPRDFVVPRHVTIPGFSLQALTLDHADADFDAVVSSSEIASGAQERLGVALADWVEDAWPFINPRYRPRLRPSRARLH